MGLEDDIKTASVKSVAIGGIISAMAFLVAFSWRDAINETINTFVPKGEGLLYLYLSAIIITIIAVAMSVILIKLQKTKLVR